MGWLKVKLGDIADIGAGNSAPQDKKLFNGGTHKFFRTSDVGRVLFGTVLESKDLLNEDGIKKLKKYKAGDILMPKSGASTFLNHRVMLGVNGYVSSHLAVISAKKTIALPSYLLYFLSTIKAQNLIQGHDYPSLKLSEIKNIDVDIPSIPEQKRIVAILDQAFSDIDKARANAEQNLKNARELFESYLNVRLLKVASEFSAQTLSDLTELIVDCEHKTAPKQNTGYPSIRTPNIGKGVLILDGVNRVSEETYDLWTRRARPMPGDLILAREAPAGNVGVIPEGEQVCLGQRTVLIRPKKGAVNPNYFVYFILHPITQKKLLSHSTGATVQHVNMKDIRALPIGVFPPLKEQNLHVKGIEKANEHFKNLESIYKQKLKSLDELKKSILQKAFTGELTRTVNQGVSA